MTELNSVREYVPNLHNIPDDTLAIEYLEGEIPEGVCIDGVTIDEDDDDDVSPWLAAAVGLVVLVVIGAFVYGGLRVFGVFDSEDQPASHTAPDEWYESKGGGIPLYPEYVPPSHSERLRAFIPFVNDNPAYNAIAASPLPESQAKYRSVPERTFAIAVGTVGQYSGLDRCYLVPEGDLIELGRYDGDGDGRYNGPSDVILASYVAPGSTSLNPSPHDCSSNLVFAVSD